jgi:HK97 gp10 family phage protein
MAKDTIKIKLEGFDTLHRRLENLDTGLRGKIVRTPLRMAMKPVYEAALKNAEKSKDTSGLKNTIKLRVVTSLGGLNRAKLSRKAFAFGEVSLGRARADLHGSTGAQALQVEFDTEKTAAQPIIRPALRDNIDKVLAILKVELTRAIKRWEKRIQKQIK